MSRCSLNAFNLPSHLCSNVDVLIINLFDEIISQEPTIEPISAVMVMVGLAKVIPLSPVTFRSTSGMSVPSTTVDTSERLLSLKEVDY